MQNLTLRIANEKDIAPLYGVAVAMKATHEDRYFERCLEGDERTVIIAEEAGAAVGYVLINWNPLYPPFRRLGYPEIQDLNVIPSSRKKGIGNELVSWCEEHVKAKGKTEIAISVGLYSRYGAAQRLYVRRGYVPDGAGVSYDDVPVIAGEMRAVDDMLTLKMVKNLG